MLVKRNLIRILCYGDSNTRGFVPLSSGNQRYETDQRWTGLLQTDLGDKYDIIEEGLDARTTNIDDPRPGFVGKNGMTYLVPCLDSHKPIDLVIFMLGTPDLKALFNRSSEQITSGMEDLIKLAPQTNILVVSPPLLIESTEFAKELFKGGREKSACLSSYYKRLADRYHCSFISGENCEIDKQEGVHLTIKGHRMMFERINAYIKNLKI